MNNVKKLQNLFRLRFIKGLFRIVIEQPIQRLFSFFYRTVNRNLNQTENSQSKRKLFNKTVDTSTVQFCLNLGIRVSNTVTYWDKGVVLKLTPMDVYCRILNRPKSAGILT